MSCVQLFPKNNKRLLVTVSRTTVAPSPSLRFCFCVLLIMCFHRNDECMYQYYITVMIQNSCTHLPQRSSLFPLRDISILPLSPSSTDIPSYTVGSPDVIPNTSHGPCRYSSTGVCCEARRLKSLAESCRYRSSTLVALACRVNDLAVAGTQARLRALRCFTSSERESSHPGDYCSLLLLVGGCIMSVTHKQRSVTHTFFF